MIKLTEHRGKLFIETDNTVEALTVNNGTVSFIHLSDSDLEKIAFELWAEAMDRGLAKLSEDKE